MALGSTQPLVKKSTRNISWGWRRPVREADNLTTFFCRTSWKSWSLNLLETSGPHRACYGTAFTYIYIYVSENDLNPCKIQFAINVPTLFNNSIPFLQYIYLGFSVHGRMVSQKWTGRNLAGSSSGHFAMLSRSVTTGNTTNSRLWQCDSRDSKRPFLREIQNAAFCQKKEGSQSARTHEKF